MLAIAPQLTPSVAPTYLEASRENQTATVSSTVFNALNIPDATLPEYCLEKFQNICNACPDPSQAAQTLASNISFLLAQAGEVTVGNAAKFEVVSNLTNNLLSSLNRDDLSKAQDAANQVNTRFNCEMDSQGKTRLDDILNALEMPYHKATHESGRMGHAREMESDVRHFFEDHPRQDLAGMLAFFHDHVQIKDEGMGVGNARHWGLNEIATAAALSTLAKEAGVDEAGQEALLKVAGAIIPAGTAFNFMPGVGGGGKPGLGTTIEAMLRSDALPVERGEASPDLIAMAYTLAICDTQRNNLAGLARPTDEVISKNAPDLYRLLSNCAEQDPEGFGAIFFDNGKLSEAGLALCSKLNSTIDVFEEFPAITPSTPMIEAGKPNNPLSKGFDSSSLSTKEREHAILELISKNGSFGSSDVAGDIESFSGVFSHLALDKMKSAPLLKDPKAAFIEGFQKFSDELKTQCQLNNVSLENVLKQMKSMGGSVLR
ncbi:hypothetical protein [Pseudomonas putida]|uniref:hypothetical protein n=1 Tax=Pseudomonas putida TaxID=303 RepID=UPI003D997D6F